MGRVGGLDEQAVFLRDHVTAAGYLKRTAEKLDIIARQRQFQRLVISGGKQAAATICDLLPRTLQENLIVDNSLEAEAPAGQVRGHILEAERQARQVRENGAGPQDARRRAKKLRAGLAAHSGRCLSRAASGRCLSRRLRQSSGAAARLPGLSLSDAKCMACSAQPKPCLISPSRSPTEF